MHMLEKARILEVGGQSWGMYPLSVLARIVYHVCRWCEEVHHVDGGYRLLQQQAQGCKHNLAIPCRWVVVYAGEYILMLWRTPHSSPYELFDTKPVTQSHIHGRRPHTIVGT